MAEVIKIAMGLRFISSKSSTSLYKAGAPRIARPARHPASLTCARLRYTRHCFYPAGAHCSKWCHVTDTTDQLHTTFRSVGHLHLFCGALHWSSSLISDCGGCIGSDRVIPARQNCGWTMSRPAPGAVTRQLCRNTATQSLVQKNVSAHFPTVAGKFFFIHPPIKKKNLTELQRIVFFSLNS